jgi:large subunit ribosomal protein LP2
VLGGNKNPDKNTLKKIIEAGGGTFDNDRADSLLKELEGKDIDEILSEGKKKVNFKCYLHIS